MAVSTGATVKIEGLKELQRQLRQATPELRKTLRQTNKEAAQLVKPAALSLVPRRSGRLAASIGVSADNFAGYIKAGTASRVPYAGVIHFGWPKRNIRPQPFLYEALSAKRSAVMAAYAAAMERLADQINR